MRKPTEATYPITQNFGENPDVYARFGLKGHNGIDYGTPTDTGLIAPITGKVIEVGWDANGYGLYMKIENAKEGCLLAHLKDNLLAAGADCEEGQLIAHSDNTGFSTGPHLHFAYYLLPRDRNNGYGGFIDPAPFLDPKYQEIEKLKLEVKEYKDGLDIANKRIKELESQVEDLMRELEEKPIPPPAPQPQETPQAPVPVEVKPDPTVEEINKKMNILLSFIEALKRFIHIKW